MTRVVIRHCTVCSVHPPRAARVAALLQRELGITAEMEKGKVEEFTILVDGTIVAQREKLASPGDRQVLEAVRAAIS